MAGWVHDANTGDQRFHVARRAHQTRVDQRRFAHVGRPETNDTAALGAQHADMPRVAMPELAPAAQDS